MTQTTDTETSGDFGPEFGEFVQRTLDGEGVSDLFGVNDAYFDQVLMYGHRFYKEGNLEKAEVLLRGARALEPKAWYPHLLLGDILLRKGEAAEALVSFEAAREVEPEDPNFVELKIGEALIRLGEFERARQTLESLAEGDSAKSSRADALLQSLDRHQDQSA